MLTLSRRHALRLRTVFSRAMGRAARSATVQFRSDGDRLAVSVRGDEVVVEQIFASRQPIESFAASLELLKRCEGAKDDPVSLERRGSDVEARWTDAGVPQTAAFPVAEPFDPPPIPERREDNDPRLIPALRDAVDSTDAASTRYALACLQLRADGGRIAATDSRQLLVQEGFRFLWEGDLLVPGNPVFACRDLHQDAVSIGRSDDWVTVQAGDWSVHLRIRKDARFPNVDSILPQAESARSVLTLDAGDAAFLRERLPKLPTGPEGDQAVTLDLNGAVVVRSRGAEGGPATELRLTNSRRAGREIRVQADRRFLGRALELGFPQIRFWEPNSTALCSDERRSFLGMLLNPEGAVTADGNSIRVDSNARPSSPIAHRVTPVPHINRRDPVLPTPQTTPRSETTNPISGPAPNESPTPTRSAVEQLVALRETLQAAVQRTNETIRVLKRQRREDRLLKSTLSSLRQLQDIAS